MRHANRLGRFLILLAAIFYLAAPPARAGESRGAFIKEIEDEDGDLVIVMETDWISMRLMPAIGSTVIRFVFRPTQNDIVDITQPKNLKSGGGLLQDNLWEQDWRFQELRGKWYDYKITKTGPEEVQVVFETVLDGWIGAKDSGIKSKLLENLKIRRTVTLQQGTPYFLFDVEFINQGHFAKLPLYWCHNSSYIDISAPDTVLRPSTLGINKLPSKYGSDYVYNFNKGWSARVSPTRKEGIVYLMDYDYLNFLYNNGIGTTEWVYDNLLVLRDHPVRMRIYILPVMGLTKVDHATEYFICQLNTTRDKDQLRFDYKLTASYKKARKVTLVPELTYGLLDAVPRTETLKSVEFTDLGIEPQARETVFTGQTSDPIKIKTTAFIDLADGTQVQRSFEHIHIGDYTFGRNIRRDMRTPVCVLDKAPQRPYIPVPAEDLKVNKKDFKIFALMGSNSRLLELEDAMRSIPKAKLEVGYHPGFIVAVTGLTDFPYDYERLFDYRVVVFNNCIFNPARAVGMSILANYLKRGGGLVFGGGENVFGMSRYDDSHPIYDYLPILKSRFVRETVRLSSPVKDHPIFKGVDLSNLPYQYYVQAVEWRKDLKSQPRVLMKIGDQPFIVEYAPQPGMRAMIVLAIPFGDPAENPGKPIVYQWPEWKKLYANIVRYAAHDL